MVSMEVQCSPRPPQMVQRAVQVVPAHVATRDAAVDGGISWEALKQAAIEVTQQKAREDVLRDFRLNLLSSARLWPLRCRLSVQ